MGPDDDILVDPARTTELGQPVGRDSSLTSREGDQWPIGGGCAWVWYSYDPALNHVFYGTLEGYLKAVDARNGRELYRSKTPSGIVGNVTAYMHGGRQYVAVLLEIGGWAGIGLAAGLTDPADGPGAVGGYAALSQSTAPGGQLTVFTLPE